MVNFGKNELVPHFIYCGNYYNWPIRRENFNKKFLRKMKKIGIQSSILTMLSMSRLNLITKEKAKEASEGKLKNVEGWKYQNVSINDDLEMFLRNLMNSKEIKEELIQGFFTPKLSKKELKLVEVKNEDHLNTYWDHNNGLNPDVDAEEMKKSDSTSKYVHGYFVRRTIPLTLEKNK